MYLCIMQVGCTAIVHIQENGTIFMYTIQSSVIVYILEQLKCALCSFCVHNIVVQRCCAKLSCTLLYNNNIEEEGLDTLEEGLDTLILI